MEFWEVWLVKSPYASSSQPLAASKIHTVRIDYNMNEKISEIFKNTPDIIKTSYVMEHPNEPILIHEGDFTLNQKERSLTLTGRVYFDWFPQQDIKFEGVIINSTDSIINAFDSNESYDLLISGLSFGKALLQNISIGQNPNISGSLHSESVLGDKTISVTKVNFAIPNLKDFLGSSVKSENKEGSVQLSKSRLVFENEDYLIIIDKSLTFKKLNEELAHKGGYAILYAGELTKKNGSISHDELQELIHCFSVFLTFLNGRRCAPLFLQGIHENDVLWTDFTSYNVDQYKSIVSWSPKLSIGGFNELWQVFSQLWKDPIDKDFLISAVHWYVESNNNSGYIEGSIIMSQVALELIYNWLVIEKKKLLIGKDGENISASNKIRLLLSQVNCKTAVPEALQTFVNDNREIVDGIEAFVQIRNAIIHSQEEKRKKLTSINNTIKYEAQQLSLHYIEYSILSILKYKGKYYNRCSGKLWSGEGEEKIRY
ncbi:hypothetical protein [Plebeiibacterium marinum]|uniref:YopA central domain-containing protein n=1 Tax=Plebeiibacterium marinum TaxID=2992111 RepID=A0AAE3MFT8_9BACT|nr:hypothetical protein [Plebeiobacterium marinum]MCW3806832.1 hypothetical protein [Plebeiobacterium marinum]